MDRQFIKPINLHGDLTVNWKRWRQEFEIYSIATELNGKDEKIQCAQLLYNLGAEGMNIFNSFTFTATEKDKIEVLKKKFEDYFVPKKNLTYERYKFFTSRQGETTVDQFITRLKNQANNCDFGTDILKNDLIKTMLVIGIKDEAIRATLLQKSSESLDILTECCVLTEATRHQLQDINTMHSIKAEPEVDAIGRKREEPRAFAKKRSVVINNCTRCGFTHFVNKCYAFGKTCNYCNTINHFASVCKRKLHGTRRVNNIDANEEYLDNSNINLTIDSINYKFENDSCYKYLMVENISKLKFKIDTGANANVIAFNRLKLIGYDINKIEKSNETLSTFTGQKIPIIGKCELLIKFGQNSILCTFYVEKGNNDSILGLNSSLKLNIIQFNDELTVGAIDLQYKKLINKYNQIFAGIGKIGEPYHIEIDKNIVPVTKPIRRIPFSIEKQFKEYLQQLSKLEIIKRIDYNTEWCNSFVVVRKVDGSLRICLDPRDLNKAIRSKPFKMPTIDDIISKLNGARYFSTLDATSGFWNIPLDDASSNLCVFGTPYGNYKFLRLPFGIKTASEIFQERFKSIFQLEGVEIYVDDILVFGNTKQEHDERLEQVFKIAQKQNIKFNLKKCKFGLSEVKYLGHKFSDKGISVDQEKIQAILNMPRPKSVKDVQRFLGLITYVGRFIQNISQHTQPLRDIIKKENAFVWNENQQKAFDYLKQIASCETILQYFNPNTPIVLSVDASSYGIGAVLLQNNKPCAYASRSLTEAQKNYAQIEKELLAIYFGVTKFHQYIFGNRFTVETDHKPLIAIFKKTLNSCPPRLQRILLSLQNYDLNVIYKPGKDLVIADSLSRAPLQEEFNHNLDLKAHVCMISKKINMTPNKLELLIKATEDDNDLSKIKNYTKNGWPNKIKNVESNLRSYFPLRNSITEIDKLLYFNDRLIIPLSWRKKMLSLIHTGHLGISKSLQKAQLFLYWPGITKDIINYIKACSTCLKYSNSNAKEPMINHDIVKIPWYKVGVDLYELNGNSYLLIVDYYSKYPEIENLNNNLTSDNVIDKMKSIFARHGIPGIVITDSGRQFTSEIFANFAHTWSFKHNIASPHHQQSNGLAERTIQSIKKLLKKSIDSKNDLYMSLLAFRNTPIYEKYTPSQILMSRYLRDNLPINTKLFEPKIINKTYFSTKIKQHQHKTKYYYDKKCKNIPNQFKRGMPIVYQKEPKSSWQPGIIASKVGPRSYKIGKSDGRSIVRNNLYIKHNCTGNTMPRPPPQDQFVYDVFKNNRNENSVVNNRLKLSRYGRIIHSPKRFTFSNYD